MKIVIGFSKPKRFKIGSWLIRKFDRVEFSHVYILFKSTYFTPENQLIYHASGTQVNFLSIANFHLEHRTVKTYEFDVDKDIKKKMVNYAASKAGKPYGFAQLLGFVYIRFMHMFGVQANNPFGESGYVCTELVAELLKKNLLLSVKKDTNDITLRDLDIILGDYDRQVNTEGARRADI